MRNIVLVGFMGTGKTTVAKTLSKKLGMKYVSTDSLVEKMEKTPIREIFSVKGEKYFRKLEKEAVKNASSMNNAVIDAGGGAVIDPANIKNLKKKGVIICLWAEPDVILERTKKYKKRPLLNVCNPLEEINRLLAERKPFYARADYSINTSKMTVKEVLGEIKERAENAAKNR